MKLDDVLSVQLDFRNGESIVYLCNNTRAKTIKEDLTHGHLLYYGVVGGHLYGVGSWDGQFYTDMYTCVFLENVYELATG